MNQTALRVSAIGRGLQGALGCYALVLFALAWPVTALADGLSGTWRGMLSTGEQSTDSMFSFSDDGDLVIEYTNNEDVTRAAELSEVGQQVQYVPDGGGVRTIEVVALEKSPGRLALRLRTRFERASGGYMDQRHTEEVLIFELTSEGLATELQVSTTSGFGDRDMSVSGEDTIVERGVLQRVE